MQMINIVIDTNIALAGFLSYTSEERKIINYAYRKKIGLVGSERTLAEFDRKLSEHPRFKKVARDFMYPKEKLLSTYKSLIRLATIEQSLQNTHFCISDPDDDIFVHAALASNTKIIVTNDNHLLKIDGVNGLKIVSSKKMFNTLQKNLGL